jgi:uncharacterized protein (DUF58 family)
MGIAVRNGKKRIPTFSLEVEDLLEGRPVERRCYYLKLPAGRMQETAYKHTLARRGRHRFTGFRISTRFPFGFIRKSRDMDSPADVLVYPALVPVPETLVRAGLAEAGRKQTPSRSRSGDFHGLREFRSGDDPRDIHWRTSAKRGRPFVRESEEETGRTVLVLFDNQQSAEVITTPEGIRAFEAAVSLAASVAVALVKKGLQVGLKTADSYVAPAAGTGQASEMLRTLALVEPRRAGDGRLVSTGGATAIRIAPGVGTPHCEVEAAPASRRSA